ncbi:MAG: DUF2291 family protein [Tolumonas sp.]|nr:DUF2291 family protein [Tolumonas sp.]
MFIKKLPYLGVIILMLILSGCDVVKLDADGKPIIPMSASAAASFDNMTPKDIAARLWGKIIPAASKESKDWVLLKSEISKVPSGQSKSFFAKIEGTVNEVSTDEKDKKMQISVGDEKIIVQLGTNVKGNSIRDASSSIIQFDLFKNQVQFARLSKELNKKAISGVVMPDPQWQGYSVNTLVAVTIRDNNVTDIVPLEINKR